MHHRIIAICLAFCLLCPLLFSCGDEGYTQKDSTKEELTAVLSFGDTEVPFEIFRTFFLNHKKAVEAEVEGGFTGDNAEQAWDKIMPLILEDLSQVYAVFALAKTYGIDPYGEGIEESIAEEIRVSVEGGSYGDYTFEGYGSYDQYLAAMKENGMNDGASRTVLRFHLCEDELLRKLTVPMKTAYDYTKSDVTAFFEKDECIRVSLLYREMAAGGIPAEENREKVLHAIDLLRAESDERQRLNLSVQYFTNSPDDILTGDYISPYAYSFEYHEIIERAYELEIGEYSDLVEVTAPAQDYYFVVNRLEKQSEDISDRFDEIVTLYLTDRFYRELDGVRQSLLSQIVYHDFYEALYGTDITY